MAPSDINDNVPIGLLAGSLIAELLSGKNGSKKQQGGYEDQQQPSYGYSGYQHDL